MGVKIETSLERFIEEDNNLADYQWRVIIDALFGFSFKPPVRDPFVFILHVLSFQLIIGLQVD